MSTKKVEDLDEDEYIVERILDKKWVKEKKRYEYLIRWEGFNQDWDTWEPEDNLGCEEILANFNRNFDKKKPEKKSKRTGDEPTKEPKAKKRKDSETSTAKKEKKTKEQAEKVEKKEEEACEEDDDDMPHGFERGLDAEAVLGATQETGELLFLVKWKNSDEADLLPAYEVNEKIPQLVIQFYQERIRWHDTE